MKTLIGEYMMGYRNVELYAVSDDTGGNFVLSPDKGVSTMEVGLDHDHWHEVFNVLLHESLEMAMCDVGARFRPNPCFATCASDTYKFMLDHNQFTEATYRASYFVCASHNALARAHRKELTARRATVKKLKRKSKKK